MSTELFTDSLAEETLAEIGFDLQEVSDRVMEAFLTVTECPYEAHADISVIGEEEMHDLNLRTRGIDDATDVLSFPASAYEKPEDYASAENDADAFEPDSGELLLGDAVISWPHVQRQALSYGHSEMREFAFLLTHSLLHLAGHDHMEEDERERMEERQREILGACGIGRVA